MFQAQSFNDAVALFDRYEQMGGKDQYLYFYRGSAERGINHMKEAERDFRKSLEFDSTFIDALLALADVLINLERFDEALEIAIRCCKSYP